ncbi:DNA-binding protein [Sulfurimonas sp.]|uniref:DNA-binding protein n=1 Tax=Sulfurimonas sp. TaxID=2022749 RepID=UPI0025E0E7FA|nr:DNA-binding protein [Sulfurimonas sp.]MDD5157778.1 DNA-binding protein [Sulfurimonas sp.]
MTKLSISEAALKLGVSKEAIFNRIRRGSLVSSVENGVKLVIIDDEQKAEQKETPKRKTAFKSDDKYYIFLEEQNSKLQKKVESLEVETRTLRDQKEQMLIEEKRKIEQIYRDKDEQLKNIINAISSKLMIGEFQVEKEIFEAEIDIDSNQEKATLVSIKKFIKSKNLSEKQSEKQKEKLKAIAPKDKRFVKLEKKYYLDLQKYNYDDLLI